MKTPNIDACLWRNIFHVYMTALNELGHKQYSGVTSVDGWCPHVVVRLLKAWRPYLSLFTHSNRFYINKQIDLVLYFFIIVCVYLPF